MTETAEQTVARYQALVKAQSVVDEDEVAQLAIAHYVRTAGITPRAEIMPLVMTGFLWRRAIATISLPCLLPVPVYQVISRFIYEWIGSTYPSLTDECANVIASIDRG